MSTRSIAADRGAILRMAGNIAGGLCARGLNAEDAAPIAVDAALEIIRIVDRRIAAEPAPPMPSKPPRTAYRSADGVYHPSPIARDYHAHAETCSACHAEERLAHA